MLKTFVINLEKDWQKRDSITKQLHLVNILDPEIFTACYGNSLSDKDKLEMGYDEFIQRYGTRKGTLPAFGCSVSHRRIYDRIIGTQLKAVLILEDDAIISKNLSEIVQPLVDRLSHTDEPIVVLLTPAFRYLSQSEKYNITSQYFMTKVERGYMTSGYLINRAGAELLCQIQTPVSYLADAWDEFKRKGLKLYGIVPHLISYPDGMGEIGMSQRPGNESLPLKARHFFGRQKAKLMELLNYAKGYRRSKKLW